MLPEQMNDTCGMGASLADRTVGGDVGFGTVVDDRVR